MPVNNSIEKYIDYITEINNLPGRVSQSLIYKLGHIFSVEDESEVLFLELTIKIKDKDVNVRELSTYLLLLDRLYGRLSPKGLRSYSRSRKVQLQISEFRKGSLEIIFKFVYEYREVTALVLIVLFLKYIPNFVKTISESTKNLVDSYKSFEEARLAKTNRMKIRETLDSEKSLEKLNDSEKDELVVVQETLLTRESKSIYLSKNFAQKYVEKISVRVRKKIKSSKK
jgi:hypothetical protein